MNSEQRQPPEGSESWPAHWTAQGMPWRTEPEIDEERQRYLAERRAAPPNIDQDIYPFEDELLDRADVEWLLATHESGGLQGPVKWDDEMQRSRDGLDLRGADVSGSDLSGLPLARLIAGTISNVGGLVPDSEIRAAALSAFGASFRESHLEGARLTGARLAWADLTQAHLEGATCDFALLSGTSLIGAHLEGTNLQLANFAGWRIPESALKELRETMDAFPKVLAPANLSGAHLDTSTSLHDVLLGDKRLGYVRMFGVHLSDAPLSQIDWRHVKRLGDERGRLYEGEYITAVQEWVSEQLPSVAENKMKRDISDASELWIYKKLALLSMPLVRLGFRFGIRQYRVSNAVQTYQQLATALRAQGLVVAANRFSYRAEVLKSRLLLYDQSLLRYLGSLLLRFISGYGYRPLRSFITYVLTIGIFAVLYWCVTNDVSLTHGLFTHALIWLGMTPPPASNYHLQGYEAIVVSMTSFHGRGFFQPVQSPGDRVAILSAIEAAVGLFIEIVFIATFTQRFFAR